MPVSNRVRSHVIAILLTAGLAAANVVPAFAEEQHMFDVPAKEARAAIRQFAAQAKVQVLVAGENVEKTQLNAVSGDLSTAEGLRVLLENTGLKAQYVGERSIALVKEEQKTSRSEQKGFWNRFRLAQASDKASDAVREQASESGSSRVQRADSMIEEIVVTAQKRQERLQDVPMSITALQATTLEETGALALQDIARQVPGLTAVTVSPGRNTLVLRGLSGGSTVGFYIDEVPLIGVAMDPALQDLDRIEILRGPQGTLYGASSLGGTVRYITKQPNLDTVEADVGATLSSTQSGSLNNEISAVANLPLVTDRAALRAVAFYRDYDGFIDRYETDPVDYLTVVPGTAKRNVNTEKTYGARISAALNISDNFSIVPSILYQRMDLGGLFTFESPPGTFDNPIQSRLMDEPEKNTAILYSLMIDGEVGPVNITSATGYYDKESQFTEDNSKALHVFLGTPLYASPLYGTEWTRNLTEELRASASFGWARLLVGAFYSRVKAGSIADWPAPDGYAEIFAEAYGVPLASFPGGPDIYYGRIDRSDEQKALFGELTVDLTSRLQAIAGVRTFRQKQSFVFPGAGVFNGATTLDSGSTEVDGTVPKFELTYRMTPSALVYASATEGFRPGGALASVPGACAADLAELGYDSIPTGFDPDTAWSYEVGAKTGWLDNALSINGAVYYIDWRDIQQVLRLDCGFNLTGNFGSAESKGAELEIRYQTDFGLNVGLGAAFNEAKIVSNPGAQAQEGDTLQNAPKWTGFASVAYRRELGADLAALARFDINTSTRVFNDFDEASVYHRSGGYSLADLRFGVERKSWQSYLFVKNVFDKRASTALQSLSGVDLPDQRRFSLNRPRTIGVEVQMSFH